MAEKELCTEKIQACVPLSLYRELRAVAATLEIPVSSLIRIAVRRHLRWLENLEKPRT